ncbi:MAG: glycerophosphodiester phosphodiesterase [Chloroflexi bacterium]|nr:glycerophosphodiester phosphodiesterase [Chloroflexota bacterium]
MALTLLRAAGAPLLRVGHRGAKGHAPENTLASFNRAVELGVNAVETDVHLSQNGEVVLIHDHTVDRTTDGHGYVKDMTTVELKKLDAGGWYGPEFAGQRILTLAELLTWAKGRVGVAIEIKNGPIYYPGIAEKVVRLVRQHDMTRQALLLSFDHLVLREAKMIAPEIAAGILYVGRLVDPVAAARAAGADAIHPQWAFVTPDLVQAAHAAGLAVSPWCPNDLPALQRLSEMGVDSVGTDYPELFDQI